MVISAKARLVSVIVAVVFMFGALAGTGAYLIINHLNNAKALNSESNYSIGNMIKSGDNDFVDYNTYSALMTKLGNDTTSTRNKSAINGGTPIVFQMGTVPGTSTPIYWEVVYQTGDTITVWMTQPYTTGQFNPSSTDGNYLYNGNYSSSYLRRDTLAIYNELNTAYPVFSKVVKSPSNAGVSSWQSSQSNAKYSSSYSSITNGLGTQTSTTNPYSWTWTSCMSDMFWIPSHYEVCNTSSSGSGSSTNGLWGLSTTDSAFTTTTLKGNVSVSYCWLRSGYSYNNYYAMPVNSSGSADSLFVNFSYGVRPAAHLSLQSLASATGYTLSASVASDATDRAQVSPASQIYVKDSGAEMTVTYTANTGYYISQITVNNLDLPISASVASAATFVNAGEYSYRCYRSDNKVIIILTNVTANLKIVGIVIPTPVTLNITGNTGSFTSTIDFDASTGNANIVIEPAANDYINTIWLDSNSPQIVNRWSDYVYQDSAAFNVSYEVTAFSNTILIYVKRVDGQVTINVGLSTVPPTLQQGGGTSISGVALQVSASGGSTDLAAVGEARITGYNQTEDLTTIHVSAWASTGYVFVGWQVDGEIISTLLSADIPYDDVEGKILVAVFEPINANTNGETDNNQTTDFV